MAASLTARSKLRSQSGFLFSCKEWGTSIVGPWEKPGELEDTVFAQWFELLATLASSSTYSCWLMLSNKFLSLKWKLLRTQRSSSFILGRNLDFIIYDRVGSTAAHISRDGGGWFLSPTLVFLWFLIPRVVLQSWFKNFLFVINLSVCFRSWLNRPSSTGTLSTIVGRISSTFVFLGNQFQINPPCQRFSLSIVSMWTILWLCWKLHCLTSPFLLSWVS